MQEYVKADGKIPFRDWLAALRAVRARARGRVRLNHLRLGNFGDARPVGDGISELRIPCGPGYRVYVAPMGSTVILLRCGGDRSTQARDIGRAKTDWMDYQRRS